MRGTNHNFERHRFDIIVKGIIVHLDRIVKLGRASRAEESTEWALEYTRNPCQL